MITAMEQASPGRAGQSSPYSSVAPLGGPTAGELRDVMGLRFWDTGLDSAAHFLVQAARAELGAVETGLFGAHMQVSLTNYGPETIWLES